jgi:hypothetical protein
MESIALFLEGGTPDERQLEALQIGELHPTRLRVGEQLSADGELALRSFAAFLVEEYGWTKLRALLATLAECTSEQDAVEEVLEAKLTELEDRWLSTLRGKEQP